MVDSIPQFYFSHQFYFYRRKLNCNKESLKAESQECIVKERNKEKKANNSHSTQLQPTGLVERCSMKEISKVIQWMWY